MQEVWLPVRGYEGLYEVSDHGRVRSVARVVPHRLKGKKTIPAKILKQGKGSHGYLTVSLWQNNKGRSYCVHTLVANAFIGETDGHRLLVNHLDYDRTNNAVGNLEITTHGENMAHGYRVRRARGIGRCSPA